MKNLLLCAILFSGWMLSAVPMGTYDPDAKCWNVKGKCFSCTFFHGCMYPVWFRSPAGGEFPFFIFVDQMEGDGKVYKIQEERWAEFNVKENSETRFVMECTGNFCTGLPPYNTPCKDVAAVYRYTIEKDSPVLLTEIHLTKEKAIPYDVKLMQLRWRFMPFKTFLSGSDSFELEKLLQHPGSVSCKGGMLLSSVMNLAMDSDKVLLRRETAENGFFYLCSSAGIQKWDADSRELNWSCKIRFLPAEGNAK